MNYQILRTVIIVGVVWLAIPPQTEAYHYGGYHYGYSGGYAHYNTYNGGYYHGGSAGYNHYTGGYGASRSYYNPYTNRYGSVQAGYNPYTNRYAYHYSYGYR